MPSRDTPPTRRSAVLDHEDLRALLAAIGRITRAGRHEMREYGEVFEAREKPSRITDRHMSAVQQIFVHEPLTVGELADRLDVAMTTASLLATELEQAGMIERERDEADRRRVLLRVRPRLAEFIVERRIVPLRHVMDALSAAERAALVKALSLYADEIERNAHAGDADDGAAARTRGS